ncbi:MAG: hypothetical protein ABIJ37_03350 [Pseudomonadota bacterium]
MLEYIVIIGLLIAAGCWIIYPLLKPNRLKGSPTVKTNKLASNKRGETVLSEADIEKEIEEEISAIRTRQTKK